MYICEKAKGLVFHFSPIKFVTSGVQLAGPAVKFENVIRFEILSLLGE